MSIGFGHLARIGHLYPSGGLCDFEIQAMAPEGVQFLTTRLPFRDTSIESDRTLIDDIELHAQLLADAKVDLIATNCTAAGVVNGPEAINARVEAATNIAAVTTIEAVLAACDAVGARKLGLVTAYGPHVVAKEKTFLAERGFEVVAESSRACATPYEQGTLSPEVWLQIATSLPREFDALLISCAGIRVSSVIQSIEDGIGRPVIASNSALLWYCLKKLGVMSSSGGYGVLLGR
ncbi:arylmalonate decarboxylase [Paraburkholderia panacisoli]|uniref:Arylmalonate decarboxylase n=1 Tax=Paraburkholderia panacisoli TaxID=2603818 RepID=A0A5B0GNJ6_9BURK|nr:aspartate/glutamate racemase family protein [Paraburkholderia panacisoli]KAA1003509.1 arylmalonate decarboxylase [Paraburkholderia panacisoli]